MDIGYKPTDYQSNLTGRDFDSGYTAGDLSQGYQAKDYQSGYQAGQFDPGYQAGDLARQYSGPTFEAGTSTDPTQIQDYMNPYTQLVTDVQKREARKQSDISGANIAQQAAQSGGLGGYREAIMQSEREGDLAQQLQDIQAAGDMANFQQARQAYESDRQNRMDLADLGLRGFEGIGRDVDRRRTAALSMAELSGQRQAQEIDRLANLESAGQRRRGLAQQGLDVGYADFLRQQAFPREQLNLYSGLLRGVPVGPGQYSAVYGNQPTAGQQVAGSLVGLAGLGMGARGGFGSTGGGWGGGMGGMW